MKLVSAQPEKHNRAHKMCEFWHTEGLQLRTRPCQRHHCPFQGLVRLFWANFPFLQILGFPALVRCCIVAQAEHKGQALSGAG